jgi:hypothetical protein
MNNRIKKTDSKFKCNIFLFLSVTVFMARLSIEKHTDVCVAFYLFCHIMRRGDGNLEKLVVVGGVEGMRARGRSPT